MFLSCTGATWYVVTGDPSRAHSSAITSIITLRNANLFRNGLLEFQPMNMEYVSKSRLQKDMGPRPCLFLLSAVVTFGIVENVDNFRGKIVHYFDSNGFLTHEKRILDSTNYGQIFCTLVLTIEFSFHYTQCLFLVFQTKHGLY